MSNEEKKKKNKIKNENTLPESAIGLGMCLTQEQLDEFLKSIGATPVENKE